jgi:hypothetical protein
MADHLHILYWTDYDLLPLHRHDRRTIYEKTEY